MWAAEEDYQKKPLIQGDSEGPLPRDPNWRGVKLEGRKFRDLVFAVIFLAMFSVMLVIGFLGFAYGDPSSLPASDTIQTETVGWITKALAALSEDKNYVIAAMLSAVVLAFVWIQAMKWFTKAFIWIMLIGGILGLAGLGVYMFIAGKQDDHSSLQYLAYITWALSVLLLIVTFFLRKKIALTAALFKESTRAVQHNPALFIVALIIISLFLVFAAFWVSSAVYLFTVPSDEQNITVGDSTELQFKTSYRDLIWFQLFVGLWTVALLSAIFQHSIAGGIATWYFSRDSHDYQKSGSPSLRALRWGFTTSFGSLAFGSLIVAIVEFINFLLEKAKRSNQANKVLKAVLSCIQCCLGSIQGIIEWINKFSFIYVAMHGDNFCKSSRGVFKLMSRNLFSAVVVDVITDFVLLIGKLLGTALVTVVVMLTMDQTSINFLSVVVIAVGTFLIFHLVANIVATGVDTVLVCYLEDLERNRDGALHTSNELHNMLQERTEKAKLENAV